MILEPVLKYNTTVARGTKVDYSDLTKRMKRGWAVIKGYEYTCTKCREKKKTFAFFFQSVNREIKKHTSQMPRLTSF